MSITLAIAKSIRQTLLERVNAETYLIADSDKGSKSVTLQRVDRYKPGDVIAIKQDNKTELQRISCINYNVITTCEPLAGSYKSGIAYVQKTYNGRTVDLISLGNPETLSSYPAITIEATSVERSPMTVGGVQEQNSFAVTCWSDATNHGDAYSTLLSLTDSVQIALYAELYPLVEPYGLTALAEPTTSTDTVIKVDDASQVISQQVIVDNDKGTRRINRPTSIQQSTGVVELSYGIGAAFEKGTPVYSPGVGTFNPQAESATFSDSRDQDKLLKASTINYSISVLRVRTY